LPSPGLVRPFITIINDKKGKKTRGLLRYRADCFAVLPLDSQLLGTYKH